MNRLVAALLGALLAAALMATTSPTLALFRSQRTATMTVSATSLPATTLSSDFQGCSGGNMSVRLNWTTVSGAKGWQIYRADKPNGNQDPTYSLLATIGSGTTLTYLDTSSLSKNKSYQYRMEATAGSWIGATSNVLDRKTPNDNCP